MRNAFQFDIRLSNLLPTLLISFSLVSLLLPQLFIFFFCHLFLPSPNTHILYISLYTYVYKYVSLVIHLASSGLFITPSVSTLIPLISVPLFVFRIVEIYFLLEAALIVLSRFERRLNHEINPLKGRIIDHFQCYCSLRAALKHPHV